MDSILGWHQDTLQATPLLFQTFGFMTEDHMWKNYKNKSGKNIVRFLTIASELTAKEGDKIQETKKAEDRQQIFRNRLIANSLEE